MIHVLALIAAHVLVGFGVASLIDGAARWRPALGVALLTIIAASSIARHWP